jgi:hypothetical protein
LPKKAEGIKEHVKRFTQSLLYEIKTNVRTCSNLTTVYNNLRKRNLKREKTTQSCQREGPPYGEAENNHDYSKMVELVLQEEELDILLTER